MAYPPEEIQSLLQINRGQKLGVQLTPYDEETIAQAISVIAMSCRAGKDKLGPGDPILGQLTPPELQPRVGELCLVVWNSGYNSTSGSKRDPVEIQLCKVTEAHGKLYGEDCLKVAALTLARIPFDTRDIVPVESEIREQQIYLTSRVLIPVLRSEKP